MGHNRALQWYALAWAPSAGLWAFLVLEHRGSVAFAATAGVVMMGSAAVLGLGVFRLAGRLPWPGRPRPGFVLRHAASALLFCLALVLVDATLGAAYEGRSPAAFLRDHGTLVAWELLMYLWLYGCVAGVSYAVRIGGALSDRELALARAEALAAQAQVRALRAQLNPHFLFNALHSLSTLVTHDPRAAEECLDRLGELLRYALDDGAAEEVTLSEEWRFVRHYLALEQVRLGPRLEVAMEADESALDCLVPSFILQPLVENAIRHGVARRVAGGRVAVSARLEGGDLLVGVEDNGPGTGPGAASGSGGFGLRALRGRLEALQGGSGSLRLHTEPGAGFVANVRLPARRASRALSA